MGKTYRGSERSKIQSKRLRGSKFKKLVPPGSRLEVDKARTIRKLEEKHYYKHGKVADGRYYTMCYGKIRYDSVEQANRGNFDGLTVVYKCEYCPKWHKGRPRRGER